MTRARTTVGATLLACFAWVGASQAHAASSTQAGNAGTITLNWEATQDKIGRPLIVGNVVTNGGKTGYCIPRLLVETLDAQGQVIGTATALAPGYLGGFSRTYFEVPLETAGVGYRVSVASWDPAGNGQ